MSNKSKETLLVNFEDLVNRDVQEDDLTIESKTNVKYSDLLAVVEKSFFRVVYKQALEQVHMIVHQNRSKKQHDIQNFITFSGRRGTGKTSAMLSIINCLNGCKISFGDLNVESKFCKLASIRADEIDEYFNLIPAILYQIIDFLDNKNKNLKSERQYNETATYKLQELQNTACELLNRYNRCCSSLVLKKIDTSNYINIVSGRHSFKIDFRNFMKELAYAEFNDENSYFMISIDDIDMANDYHSEIFKSIQMYLMIPNVIIIGTTEFKFLIPEIKRNFYDNLLPSSENDRIGKISQEQTIEYLKKIIPSDNRVVMPSWKKKDYAEMLPIMLNMGKEEDINIFKENFPKLEGSEFIRFMKKNNDNKYQITPKQLILMMIANRTKIYFDAKGHKYHFFEPMSLRNMYDLFYFLYSMNNIIPEYEAKNRYIETHGKKSESNMYYTYRTDNRKRLMDYIHFTLRDDMAFDNSTDEFLESLISQPIERRGKMIWERYYSLLTAGFDNANPANHQGITKKIIDTYGSDFYKDQIDRHDVKKYSFGELFRIFFTSTRTGVFDNKFIKFILATYSVSLPAFVENEKYSIKNKKNEESKEYDKKLDYKRLIDFYGSSLLGSWCDDLFDLWTGKRASKYKKRYIKINGEEKFSSYDILRIVVYVAMSPKLIKGEKIYLTILKDNPINLLIGAEVDPTSFFINILWLNSHREDKIFHISNTQGNLYADEYELAGLIELFAEEDFYNNIDTIFNELKTFFNDTSNNNIIKKLNDSNIKYNKHQEAEPKHNNQIENYQKSEASAYPSNEYIDLSAENKKWKNNNKKDVLEELINYIIDSIIKNYEDCYFSNLLKHVDLMYNVIKRSLTDLIYVTPHDVIKKVNETGNSLTGEEVIRNFYDKMIIHLKENDEIYFSGLSYDMIENKKANYFSERFKKSILYKLINEKTSKAVTLYLKPIK